MSNQIIIEHDDKADNYRQAVIRLDRGYSNHRCGYVGVNKAHPLHGKDYDFEIRVNADDVKLNPTDPVGTLLNAVNLANGKGVSISYLADVHGGITYAGQSEKYPVESDGLWWFGFDAAHYGDDQKNGGQPLEYMVENCQKLADFLKCHEIVGAN